MPRPGARTVINLKPKRPSLCVPLQTLSAVLATATTLGLCTLSAQAETLAEVYTAARSFDATYLAAKAQADAAQAKAAQAKALFRPTVGLTGNYTHNEVDPPPTGQLSSDSSQLALQARQPLLNRANSFSLDQAERTLHVAQADLDTAEQELIVRTAQAYFDVLGAQDALTTAQANKKAIAEQLASAKRSFEVGTSTITDTREAQARFDLSTAQELAADNDLRTKRIVLDQLVGRQGVSANPLSKPVTLPDVTPANADAWVAFSETAPLVRKARLGLDIAQLETGKAQAGHWPTLDAVGSIGRSRSTGEGASTLTRGTTDAASVGLQLAVPLYAGHAVSNRVKETVSLEEKARNDLEAARRSVSQGTRQAFFGLQSGLAQVKALEAAESSTKLALEATQLGYKVGVRVNLDVLNAQTQLFTTQRDLAKARYDVVVNSLKLRQGAGTLKPDDVQAVNQWISPIPDAPADTATTPATPAASAPVGNGSGVKLNRPASSLPRKKP